jgi:hypothetical protein
VQHLYGALEAEPRIWWHRHRIPEVELVVALVVVRDAGMRVDRLGGGV